MNILIALRYKIVRDGITKILTEDPDISVVGTAQNREELCGYDIRGNKIDVVVIDLDIPGLDSLDTLKKILKDHSNTSLLAISDEKEPQQIKGVMQAGASGYILKKRGAKELIKAVKEVYADNQYLCDESVGVLIKGDHVYSTSERVANLTKRELEVLQLICREYINREIAEELGISVRTVDAHRRNLLQKTGAKNTVGLVKFAIKNDLVSLK
ncbi:LuxR C-terminal-related transcriptional regulator [Fodinibius sp. SL11]|uniref:LuxR C-terminal-related transcriptional regulator n=1 Tax=Fodinibius sp. SL11 TaxID=3425690 RepID=UPI003F883525